VNRGGWMISKLRSWIKPTYDDKNSTSPNNIHSIVSNTIKVMKNIPYNLLATDFETISTQNINDKHCCNIFIPPDTQKRIDQKFPVIIFIHGGSWRRGDRSHRYFDVYGNLAKYLASAGYIVVVPSYRLSPAVKHPSHCEDIALSLRFVDQNIHQYGGNRNIVFLIVLFTNLCTKFI
jgi:acetyl esterase/lipase